MIKSYDKLHRAENSDALAQKSIPVPSPEDAALAELVPEGEAAYAQNTAPSPSDLYGYDPANLGILPEVSVLDVNVGPGAQSASETPQERPAPSANTPALSPADIYGN